MKSITDIITAAEEYAESRNITLSTLGNLVMNNPRHYERLRNRDLEVKIAKDKLDAFIKANPVKSKSNA